MKQKPDWKNQIPLFCGGLCLLVLLGAGAGVNSRRNAGTYRLETIAGDPAALAPYRIEAALVDALHTQTLLIEDGQLSHQYRRKPVFGGQRSHIYYMNNQAYVEHPEGALRFPPESEWPEAPGQETGAQRKVLATDTVQLVLMLEEWEVRNQWARRSRGEERRCTIPTDVRIEGGDSAFFFAYSRADQHFEEEPYALEGWSVVDPALATLYAQKAPHVARTDTGEVYVFPQVSPACGGEAALYRIDEWAPPQSYSHTGSWPDGDTYFRQGAAQGRATRLASLPLAGQGIQTLHLAEVGGRLTLLYTRQDMLTLRVYTKDGALLLEQALCCYTPPQDGYECRLDILPTEEGHTLCYELYGTGDERPANLLKSGESQHFAVSLRENAAALLSRCTSRQDQTTVRAAYLDNHWVMLLDDGRIYAYDGSFAGMEHAAGIPKTHMATLQVLDQEGAPLYTGALYTDAAQDQLQFQQASEPIPGLITGAFMQFYSGLRTLQSPEGGISRR